MSEGTIRIIERSPARFPVLKSVGEVYRGVFTQVFGLARVAWLPLAFYAMLGTGLFVGVQIYFASDSYRATMDAAGPAGRDALLDAFRHLSAQLKLIEAMTKPLEWMAAGFAAIAFHRFVLLGERKHGWRNTGVAIGRREITYVGLSLLLGITSYLPYYLLVKYVIPLQVDHGGQVAFAFIALSPVMLLVYGAFIRMSLMLPHVAIGGAPEFGKIWRASTDQTWRLAVYAMLFVVPLWIETLVVARYLDMSPLLMVVARIAIWVVTLMISVTMLSVAYREIIGLPETDAADGQGDDTLPAPTPA